MAISDTIKLPEGYQLTSFESIGSTNVEARHMAEQGADDGTVIVAAEQTGGRGRMDREWISSSGNLFVSVLLRVDGPPARIAQLSMVATVAMGEAIMEYLSDPNILSYKWPNDILINQKKASGMLLESGFGSGENWVVIGTGVNLVSHPDNVMYPATDLRTAGTEISIEGLLSSYLHRLKDWRERWQQGIGPVRDAWISKMEGIGSQVRIQLPKRDALYGQFKELTQEGALVLEMEGGKTLEVSAGDLFFN